MPRKPYLGDPPDENPGAKEFLSARPTTDHIVKSWSATRGRKTALTSEVIDEICTLVCGGVPIPVASAACGHGAAWCNWNRKAKEHMAEGVDSIYSEWGYAIVEAKAIAHANAILQITGHKQQWKASAWWLEKNYGLKYDQAKQSTVTVKTEAQIAASRSTAELEAELASYETAPKD